VNFSHILKFKILWCDNYSRPSRINFRVMLGSSALVLVWLHPTSHSGSIYFSLSHWPIPYRMLFRAFDMNWAHCCKKIYYKPNEIFKNKVVELSSSSLENEMNEKNETNNSNRQWKMWCSIRTSHKVIYPSTNLVEACLRSEFWWDVVV
jgi:hypothetical protein